MNGHRFEPRQGKCRFEPGTRSSTNSSPSHVVAKCIAEEERFRAFARAGVFDLLFQESREWHRPTFVALRCSELEFAPNLDSIVRDIKAASIEIHVPDSQSNRLSPAQAGICEDAYQQTMLSRILCKSANVGVRKVTVLLLCTARKIHAARRIDQDSSISHSDIKNASKNSVCTKYRGSAPALPLCRHLGDPPLDLTMPDFADRARTPNRFYIDPPGDFNWPQ